MFIRLYILALIAFLIEGFSSFQITGNQLTCSSLTEKMSHQDASYYLSLIPIGISSYGNCFDRNNAKCTSLEQINCGSLCFIAKFKQASNCKIDITAGTEIGHELSEKSHSTGYRLSINLDSCNYVFITKNYRYITEFRLISGAPQYMDSIGNIFTLGGNSWDILINTC